MKKALTAAALVLLFCLLSAAAGAEPSTCPYDIHLSILYNYLSEPMQTLVDRLYDALYKGETVVKVPGGISRDDAYWATDFVVNETPELCAFFRNGSQVVSASGGLEIHLAYNLEISEQQRFIRKVASMARAYAGKGESQGIRAIHDDLSRIYEYGWGDIGDTQLAYYALLNGKAVCNGYAQTMVMFSHFAGYTCSYIDGNTLDEHGRRDGGRHAWNIACADGRYFWLDATWDDAGSKAVATWYNLDGATMAKSHEPDPEYRPILNLKTVLPDQVRFTTHLDVNNGGGYTRGITQENGVSVRLRDLGSGEYYSPALVIWNSSRSPVTLTITYSLDGNRSGWGPWTVQAGTNTAFRIRPEWLRNYPGPHEIIWYCGGIRLGSFSWNVQ